MIDYKAQPHSASEVLNYTQSYDGDRKKYLTQVLQMFQLSQIKNKTVKATGKIILSSFLPERN